ncbi:hypothetical protein [Arthrobacter woluwensis]|uniref:Uncharacterized protein n=1 Tax=Arthrobacter woluwensis TaxID=156980 RepID=A0A1H4R7I0_9MICC|nr:hypothetical protein [Arthrobacter woluwensis]SEC27835.1 hypothetical protein SAMN04489745_2481 [Arthrobacter woluwensis]
MENLPGGSVGSAVDYLTRLAQLRRAPDERSIVTALVDVFGVSIAGAMRISEHTEHSSAAADARSALWELGSVQDDHGAVSFVVDETAVRVACQLATYDVGLRVGVQFYHPQSTQLDPDAVTTSHILTIVERARLFLKKHGPITCDGFIFADPEKHAEGDRGGYTELVTSGDGDFLTEDTLWDFKVSASKPNKDHTLQVLMYFLMGKESGLLEFDSLTHIGLFNPRLGTVHRLAVADVPADVVEIVRCNVIGYSG